MKPERRDVGLALAGLSPESLRGVEPADLRLWCDGVEEVAAFSVRAAQAFAVSSLDALVAGGASGVARRIRSGSCTAI